MTDVRMSRFQSVPSAIKNLIIVNVLMFMAQFVFQKYDVEGLLALHYYKSPDFRIYQLVTHMFLHSRGLIFHLIFNMFALWMFGSILENLWGTKRFLLFYFVCGIGAGICQIMANAVELNLLARKLADGRILVQEYEALGGAIFHSQALGASGAVMGVFAAFAYLFPNTQLFIIPFPFPVKAKYAISALILLDLFGGIYPQYGGNIAHFAHLGGVLFGFVLVKTMNKNNRRSFY
jgi:membrane associated rhomboid family serine protease